MGTRHPHADIPGNRYSAILLRVIPNSRVEVFDLRLRGAGTVLDDNQFEVTHRLGKYRPHRPLKELTGIACGDDDTDNAHSTQNT